ncbi:MAG: GAF domain-containing protein [Phycisphaerales bacterium]
MDNGPTTGQWPRTEADYNAALDNARARIAPHHDRDQRAEALIHALWEAFGSAEGPTDRGYSWVGIYYAPAQPIPPRYAGDARATVPDDQMLLGPCRNKPACSPIGLQGMCGRSFLERAPIIVDDVRTLGTNYIACDPRDQSELVIPLIDAATDTPWGVLDIDSYATSAFIDDECRWLGQIIHALALTSPASSESAAPVLRF